MHIQPGVDGCGMNVFGARNEDGRHDLGAKTHAHADAPEPAPAVGGYNSILRMSRRYLNAARPYLLRIATYHDHNSNSASSFSVKSRSTAQRLMMVSFDTKRRAMYA